MIITDNCLYTCLCIYGLFTCKSDILAAATVKKGVHHLVLVILQLLLQSGDYSMLCLTERIIMASAQPLILSAIQAMCSTAFIKLTSHPFTYKRLLGSYFSVFKLLFTLRPSASAGAPLHPTLFDSRLWKRVLQN